MAALQITEISAKFLKIVQMARHYCHKTEVLDKQNGDPKGGLKFIQHSIH